MCGHKGKTGPTGHTHSKKQVEKIHQEAIDCIKYKIGEWGKKSISDRYYVSIDVLGTPRQ
jgi:hypothetical protein